jgi:hypothetical protein
MKNLSISILFFSSFAMACSPKTYDSVEWQNSIVAVDDLIDDWFYPLRFYDYKSKKIAMIPNDFKTKISL